MAIIFFIMFLIILGILIYFIYDYITYKEVVDDTVVKIRDVINTSNQILKGSINSNKNNIELIEKNLKITIEDEKLRNDLDTQKISTLENNLNKFDCNLKKFFQFTKNNAPISDKLFEHQFDTDANNTMYKVNLLKRINAATGMTIRDDMQICSPGSDCMKFEVDDSKFKIAPSSPNTINYMFIESSANAAPLASFGFTGQNKGVYFGGSNQNEASIYYKQAYGGSFNVAEDKMNFRRSAGSSYTIPHLKEGVSNIVELIDTLNIKNSDDHLQIFSILSKINTGMYNSYSNLEVIASYSLSIAGAGDTLQSQLVYNVLTLQDIYGTEQRAASISLPIPSNVIGASTSTNSVAASDITKLHDNTGANVATSDISISIPPNDNNVVATIGVKKNIPKYSTLSFKISKAPADFYGIGTDLLPKSGIIYGQVINNNYPSTYLPHQIRQDYNSLNTLMTNNDYFYPSNSAIQSARASYPATISTLKTPFNR